MKKIKRVTNKKNPNEWDNGTHKNKHENPVNYFNK